MPGPANDDLMDVAMIPSGYEDNELVVESWSVGRFGLGHE